MEKKENTPQDIRLDGKYYCSICGYGIPRPISFTDDYDMEEEAIEAAQILIEKLRSRLNERRAE